MIYIKKNIIILEENIRYRAIRSSGPGGQHINKVSTGIHLQYNMNLYNYPNWFVLQLKKISGHLLSKSGILTIKAISYRSQVRNKENALKRLVELFKKASIKTKKRINTRPSLGVKKKRLELKRKKSYKKKLRKAPKLDD